VLGVDVDAARAEATAREVGDCVWLRADLIAEGGVDAVCDWLAQQAAPDVVIHNAGISAVGRFDQVPVARQLAVLRLNLRAPLLLTHALLQRSAPQVVFISSLSHFVGYAGAPAYAASKDGVAHLARCLRAAGLRTLTVYPGPTRTAHAARYSPDNTREARRMRPEQLAEQIFAAQQRGARTLTPGLANRAMAAFGRWMPGTAGKLMKRVLLDKINTPLT
jgi:short-subunit dehydrogenase